MKKMIFAAFLLFTYLSAFSCEMNGKGGFLPKNDMSISVDSKIRNDMTKERFNEIIDKVMKAYKPIVKKRGGILRVSKKWKDNTVNASAMRLGPLYIVNMFGGLARHKDVTDDAFALVVCHELGHHLGGAPKNSSPMGWSSNEGQSDYWGQMKCFRRVFGGDDNRTIVSQMTIDENATKKCEEVWTNQDDIALCQRASMAGYSLSLLLSGGRNTGFNSPDRSVVSRTNNRHPKGQCRLDTYFQGALCDISYEDDVSSSDATIGTCNRKDGYALGIRPLCWYKPKV